MLTHKDAIQLLEQNKIEKLIDNTLLKADAKEEEIINFINKSINYNFYSVCINPCWVKLAKQIIKNQIFITTVIGFPLGANTTKIKKIETEDALENGADEIDMVINIGFIKSKKYNEVEKEIKEIKDICKNKILKVIIETCLLDEEEKKIICKIILNSFVDFVKTSTGFSISGANIDDIKLIKTIVGDRCGIKASGGIGDFEQLKCMIMAGATRIGTSKGEQIISKIKFERRDKNGFY